MHQWNKADGIALQTYAAFEVDALTQKQEELESKVSELLLNSWA